MEPTEKTHKLYATTGITLLDLVVGGGNGMGFLFGKIINIIGDKSSGKTFLANEIIAANNALYKKLDFNFDDGESGYSFDTKALYGMEIVTEDSLSSKTIEEFDVNVSRFLKRQKPSGVGIYVLDSLDGLSNDETEDRSEKRLKAAEAGKKFEAGTYGMKTPKFLSSEFFKTQTAKFEDKNALLIIISQVRQNIDPTSFKKWDRSGGKALDFYAHTCLWLATVSKIQKTIRGEKRTIGVVVKAKTDKSKTARPFRECTFSLYFDYGVDNVGSNIDYLFDLRGKDGQLLAAAERIPWGGKVKNLVNMKEFLSSRNLLEQARALKKEETGKKELTEDWVTEYIEKTPELKAAADEHFGRTYTRDELIREADANPEMEKEITKRVIDKWEAIETQLKTDRRRKYA